MTELHFPCGIQNSGGNEASLDENAEGDDPFCSRRAILLWVLGKSHEPLSLLPKELVKSRICPMLAPPLASGHWVLLDGAVHVSGNKKVVMSAQTGCGTTRVPWSVPICNDGSSWRFAARMSPLGLLGIDNLLEYDAASAHLRRRSANGGWGSPEGITPPINTRGRRASSLVIVDVDTQCWKFRIGLDKWLSAWAPLCVSQTEYSQLKLSVVLLRNRARAEFVNFRRGHGKETVGI